jgi:putative ABC transport system substrate-binding protein
MNRRDTMLALLALGTVPRVAWAQLAGKTYRVGYLQTATREQQLHLVKAFEDGLTDRGYRVGQNIVIEYRFADAKEERLPALAADLVRANVDVIVTGANPNTIAALKATATTPIVMATATDPVGAGLVASLARPAGNITGLTQDTGDEIYGKRLELLKDVVARLSRVAVLWNPNFAPNHERWKLTTGAARKLGLEVLPFQARGSGDLESAFGAMVKKRANALLVFGDPVMYNFRSQIGRLAGRHRLPAISHVREMAQAGLLLSYGVDFRDLLRRAAGYVDRILKGAKPGELPIEQPTRFELVINRKAGKALGLTIPQSVLLRADEVIE